jgi:anaerobic selenocysteine-containing dehydrogenase
MAKPGIAPPESVVQTACPLDCPDACTLNVTVRGGRVMKIDGATENHITDGYICAKVRRFPERLYGDDRLLYPAIRRGTKGSGLFKRATWDDALDLIAEKMQSARANGGAETILPLCYGGSNGYLTQDYADAILFRRLGTSRLLRTVARHRPALPTPASTARWRRSATRIIRTQS